MTDNAHQPNLKPKIFRFSDIDQFRSSVRSLDVDFTPLVSRISAKQIILNLEGCDVNLMRSFPRIIDARLMPNCTAIGVLMDDGIPMRFNGVECDRAVVVIGNGGATYSAVERMERRFAMIVFRPPVDDRGWPKANKNFNIFETSPIAQQRLRRLVVHVLLAAARFDNSISPRDASAAIRESLLAGVDAVFADVIPAKWASRANSTRQFEVFQDVRAVLAGSLAAPVYSEELARQVGISVRAMHDAVRRYRGMSLHRYVRLRRLWLVRKRLLEGGTDSVKACALAFGFWHLGDFSASYRLQFGEPPSETLARSRRR